MKNQVKHGKSKRKNRTERISVVNKNKDKMFTYSNRKCPDR